MNKPATSGVIEAAQLRTSLSVLAAQLQADKITREEYDKIVESTKKK